MTTVRRVIREKAFQSLFQLSTNKELKIEEAMKQALASELETNEDLSIDKAMEYALPEGKNGEDIVRDGLSYLKTLVIGVLENQNLLDEIIANHLNRWSISRLERTNLLILRIASYELLYQEEIDARIVINEAIELTKSFNNDKSSKFINGVLQSILDSKEA